MAVYNLCFYVCILCPQGRESFLFNMEYMATGVDMKVNTNNIQRRVGKLTNFILYFNRLIFTITRGFQSSRFILHLNGKLRRLWMVHFQKKYVEKQVSLRQGACRQCGVCCNLLFICPMLTQKGKCLVYGLCRPRACTVFPINQRDIDEIKLCGGRCGYSFKALFSSKKDNRGKQ